MKPLASSRRAFADDNLLGHVLAGPTFRPHRILLMAAFGEELTDEERVIFQKFTNREREPGERVREFCVVAGRRTAKTSGLMSTAATYISGLVDLRRAEASGDWHFSLLSAGPTHRETSFGLRRGQLQAQQNPEAALRAAQLRRDRVDKQHNGRSAISK
jgi:hypothetical protein